MIAEVVLNRGLDGVEEGEYCHRMEKIGKRSDKVGPRSQALVLLHEFIGNIKSDFDCWVEHKVQKSEKENKEVNK